MFEMTPTYLATDEDTLPGFLGRFKNKILQTILSADCELADKHKAYIDSLDLTEQELDLVKNKADYLTFSQSLPVGVMRGDLWRYMVIYIYGGVYADLDTECWEPISVWMKDEYDMIVCPENDVPMFLNTPYSIPKIYIRPSI